MELTREQAEALRGRADAELELTDPLTRRQYMVVPKEFLERLREDAEDSRHARGWAKAVAQGQALALEDDE
jgi:hypothetical protein